MLRLTAGKRWEYSRTNEIVCIACSGEFRGLRHPLLLCNNIELMEARRRWKEECYKHVNKKGPATLRPKMLEVLHACFKVEGGEYACMGNFL